MSQEFQKIISKIKDIEAKREDVKQKKKFEQLTSDQQKKAKKDRKHNFTKFLTKSDKAIMSKTEVEEKEEDFQEKMMIALEKRLNLNLAEMETPTAEVIPDESILTVNSELENLAENTESNIEALGLAQKKAHIYSKMTGNIKAVTEASNMQRLIIWKQKAIDTDKAVKKLLKENGLVNDNEMFQKAIDIGRKFQD